MSNEQQAIVRNHREDYEAYRSIDYSGFIERLFARCVDFILSAGFGYLIYIQAGLIPAIIAALIFDLAHRIALTYFLGGTVGKLLFGVRVVSRCSGKLSIWQVFIREFSKLISRIPLSLGYILAGVTKRKRAWHDIIACTAVISGGREEAAYAREVYAGRPERWNVLASGIITGAFVIVVLITVNHGASYILNYNGMIGFSNEYSSPIGQYKYKLPAKEAGIAGINKNVIQLGDIDGDGGYEIFREYIKDDKAAITDIRLTGAVPADGELGGVFDKPIIQYRLLDMNGDKKDELAVMFEDKSIKVYKLEGGMAEIGSFGPVEYKEISAFIKGKPADNLPYRLYVLGDKNKVTVLSMKDGKIENQNLELPGQYNVTGACTGTFWGKYCLAAVSDNGKIIFFNYDGKAYQDIKSFNSPAKGDVRLSAGDINADGKSEVILSSPSSDKRKYPVLAAYDVSGGSMKLIWDGGKYYKYKNTNLSLAMDDGFDFDKDKNFEAFMVEKKISGQEGTLSFFVFEGSKIMLKVNEGLRVLSFSRPR
jgi:Predicted membrane protein/domain